MVFNPDKCFFMLLYVGDELQTDLVLGNKNSKNSKQEVLGVIIDCKLKFATLLSNITKSADSKLNVLPRIQNCTTTEKKNAYHITHLLSGTLINVNLVRSTLIYLMLTNEAVNFLRDNSFSWKLKLSCVKACKN